ncbi:hypothetical protein Adt_00588 [Abeliophyllum distichum]|uniref:Uncharacterized protein n=1 Tax=Abeliophyllum distichum TaxID=126358 RepID=A0ABD1VQH0_9LAMI
MATSSFKSTTKRTPIGSSSEDSGTNNGRSLRRSRSLSRFSRPLPPEEPPEYIKNAPRGKFVNTVRGSAAFLDISLDDLALEFFLNDNESDWSVDRERDGRGGGAEIGRWASDTASSSRRRGRSVSKSRWGDVKSVVSNGTSGKNVNSSAAGSRRRRSLSVARYQISDSENEPDHSWNSSSCASTKGPIGRNNQMNSSKKSTASSNRRLGRSLSQKDLSLLLDDHSSYSSALTDDESKDAHYFVKNGFEKTIQAVYAQKRDEHPTEDVVKSGLYEAMRKELKYAVEEIRMDLNQANGRNQVVLSGDCLRPEKPEIVQDFSSIRENYAATLEQSEKRKQNLLAEMLLEEQRSRELSKIIRELLPDAKSAAIAQKPSGTRKRNSDRSRMSKRLTEEAEKYFEDFISNVEDTDISSFDGERSDGSSTLGGTTRASDVTIREAKSYHSPAGSSCPIEMEGVVLPWLQWETSHDCSLSGTNMMQTPDTPETLSLDSKKDANSLQDLSSHSKGALGSWSWEVFDCLSSREESGGKCRLSSDCQLSHFDMEEYVKLQNNDELLFEMYTERKRINAGSLLLCTSVL